MRGQGPANHRRALTAEESAGNRRGKVNEEHGRPEAAAKQACAAGWSQGAPDHLAPHCPVRCVRLAALALAGCVFFAARGLGEQRFPPPDFESGHQLPVTTTPPARALWLEYTDVAVLVVALGVACWLIYRRRSRRGVFALSVFSLAYFGFYRQGCVCAIGSVQNVALALFDTGYAVPLTVLAFFAAPLVVALFAGRAFCSAVCPHGALQDLVLLKPVKVPFWLEQTLSVLPYLYLGAGALFAATGAAFVICRYDPFVPLFRLSGGWAMLTAGAALLVVGMFVGRPYCRFLCPYGALLRLAAVVSRWRVRITPDVCTQCRLCEGACPFGAIREPASGTLPPARWLSERRRLGWLLGLLPGLLGAGAWLGVQASHAAARAHPTVALAERYLRERQAPVHYGVQTPAALALERAQRESSALLTEARDIQRRFERGGLLFGVWTGLVIGAKLISLSVQRRRTDFEPDRGACLACARCFAYCPNERLRAGMPLPAAASPANFAASVPGTAVVSRRLASRWPPSPALWQSALCGWRRFRTVHRVP